MSGRPVDRHRQAAYDAERFAFEGSWLAVAIDRDDAVALTERIVTAPAWRRLVPEVVRHASARRAHSFCTDDLRIGYAASVEVSTVAHELAHAVTQVRLSAAAAHGPEWRGWFVTVVEIVHGTEAADGLAEAFATYGLPLARPAVEWTGRPLVGMG